MYLSNPRRIQLVLLYLIRSPWFFPRYLRDCCFSKSPLQKSLPWWAYESIDWVKKNLHSSTKVFEWGSGGSTVFLSGLCQKVVSVENDEKWLKWVLDALDKKSIQNVSVLLRETKLASESQFQNSDYLNALSEKFDFIVVDGEDSFGPEMTWSAREICFKRAEEWINPKGFILVDDSWRYPKIRKISNAKKVLRFESIGPCRQGITTTDLHFY